LQYFDYPLIKEVALETVLFKIISNIIFIILYLASVVFAGCFIGYIFGPFPGLICGALYFWISYDTALDQFD